MRLSFRRACCKLAALLRGHEQNINTVPYSGIDGGGTCGYKPHLVLSLFQDSVGGPRLPRSNLGFAAGNPVPPADFRHGKVSVFVELTGFEFGNPIPVASLRLSLDNSGGIL